MTCRIKSSYCSARLFRCFFSTTKDHKATKKSIIKCKLKGMHHTNLVHLHTDARSSYAIQPWNQILPDWALSRCQKCKLPSYRIRIFWAPNQTWPAGSPGKTVQCQRNGKRIRQAKRQKAESCREDNEREKKWKRFKYPSSRQASIYIAWAQQEEKKDGMSGSWFFHSIFLGGFFVARGTLFRIPYLASEQDLTRVARWPPKRSRASVPRLLQGLLPVCESMERGNGLGWSPFKFS